MANLKILTSFQISSTGKKKVFAFTAFTINKCQKSNSSLCKLFQKSSSDEIIHILARSSRLLS